MGYNNAYIDGARSRKNTASIIFLLHLAAVIFLLRRAYFIDAYYWAAAFIVASSLPYIFIFFGKKFIFHEGIYLVLGGFAFSHVAPLFLPLEHIDCDPFYLSLAMKAATLGAVSFILGYQLTPIRLLANMLPLKNFVADETLLPKISSKFYLFWLILFIGPKLPFFRIPSALFAMVEVLMSFLLFAALMIDVHLYFSESTESTLRRTRKKYLYRIIFFTSLYALQCFFAGFIGKVSAILILMSLVYLKTKRRLLVVPIIIACITAILFLSYAVPFTKSFRAQYWKGADVTESIKDALTRTEYIGTQVGFESSLKRFSVPLYTTVICFKIREEGKRIVLYEDFLSFFARFVPRLLWPDKPVSFSWNRIGRELGMLHETDYVTSVAFPFLSSLVLNGGFLSVSLGMFLGGLIIRLLWEWLVIRSRDNFLSLCLYLIVIYSWMFGTFELGALIIINTSFLGYTYLLLSFMKKRRH